MEPIYRVEKINRYFRSGRETVHALKDIELSILPGRLTILRGRSGSGKTCSINVLGALDRPDDGRVTFAERDIVRMSDTQRDSLRRKEFGFVFQSVALIGMMSAYENVEFGLRVAGVPSAGRQKRAEDALAMVGMAPRMKHRPGQLSGGEQQRVAIARAIAHRPRVLFADEPTAELDSQMSLQIMGAFKRLVAEENLTVIMTTHDPNMQDLADDVYTLEDGRVIEHKRMTPLGGGGTA